MKGIILISNLDEMSSGGNTIMVQFSRIGELRIILQFLTSGIMSLRILMHFIDAVAVIMHTCPPMQLNSPLERSIAGMNGCFPSLSVPQLTTENVQKMNLT